MVDDMTSPWLSIIGIGEDGLEGLNPRARHLVEVADLLVGGRRHLDLAASLGKSELVWDSPLAETIPKLLAHRGRRVVVLASGDPFWHGVGTTLSDHIPAAEMQTIPAPSTASLVAARLRWRLDDCVTLAVHARPLALLRPHLRPGARLIVLVRDGEAPAALAATLTAWGFGLSRLTVLEALGGPRERIRFATAAGFDLGVIAAPVAVAIEPEPDTASRVLPRGFGLDDAFFEHDGQLTKREIRAVTLSSLAPRGGELLWDIGTGAGSIAIEWLLANPRNTAIGIEARADRLERARGNAERLGVPHLDLRHGTAPDALAGLPTPAAIFIGGGASRPGVLDSAWQALRPGGRLVANAVTLESEAALIAWHAAKGGTLIRLAVDRAEPVGTLTGWRPAMPVTQWSVTA